MHFTRPTYNANKSEYQIERRHNLVIEVQQHSCPRPIYRYQFKLHLSFVRRTTTEEFKIDTFIFRYRSDFLMSDPFAVFAKKHCLSTNATIFVLTFTGRSSYARPS